MIGPETRGATPIRFARATASSVLGWRSLKFHAAKLKTIAKIGMARPITRTKKGFSFVGAERLLDFGGRGATRPTSLPSKSGFPLWVGFMGLCVRIE